MCEPEACYASKASSSRSHGRDCGRARAQAIDYLEAFSFFLAFFSFTVSLGLLVVLDFSWPLGILQNSLRKPNLARSF